MRNRPVGNRNNIGMLAYECIGIGLSVTEPSVLEVGIGTGVKIPECVSRVHGFRLLPKLSLEPRYLGSHSMLMGELDWVPTFGQTQSWLLQAFGKCTNKWHVNHLISFCPSNK